jgi:hypothetical protein
MPDFLPSGFVEVSLPPTLMSPTSREKCNPCLLGNLISLVVPVATLICAGCAGVSHRAIDDSRADSQARGFRYYDASLYMLVQTDNQGGLVSTLKWLPDQTKLRQARPYKFLAKNESTFEFKDGVLAKSDSIGDGTIIPKAFISAAEKVISAGIKGGANLEDTDRAKTTPAPDSAPRIYLFKIIQVDGEYLLVGDEGYRPVYKTISQ